MLDNKLGVGRGVQGKKVFKYSLRDSWSHWICNSCKQWLCWICDLLPSNISCSCCWIFLQEQLAVHEDKTFAFSTSFQRLFTTSHLRSYAWQLFHLVLSPLWPGCITVTPFLQELFKGISRFCEKESFRKRLDETMELAQFSQYVTQLLTLNASLCQECFFVPGQVDPAVPWSPSRSLSDVLTAVSFSSKKHNFLCCH